MSARHDAYHRAAAAKDHAAVVACLADGIRMHSPTKLKPFEGKAMVAFLFGHLFEVLEDFAFTEVAQSDERTVLFFRCRIAGKDAEGIDVLHFDADGRIDDFRVMIRPLVALEALNAAMGARLAAAAAEGRLPTQAA